MPIDVSSDITWTSCLPRPIDVAISADRVRFRSWLPPPDVDPFDVDEGMILLGDWVGLACDRRLCALIASSSKLI